MGSIARELTRHPDTPAPSVKSISVQVERSAAGRLCLRYHVEGTIDALVLPPPAEQLRRDDLWKTTCLELFVRVPAHPDYAEFNFSPSLQWAAYHFGCYRGAMNELDVREAPDIRVDASETHFALETFAEPPIAWRTGRLEIGLSAVIEEVGSIKSYWALQHPPGRPDFHHPDCFALELAPPDGS